MQIPIPKPQNLLLQALNQFILLAETSALECQLIPGPRGLNWVAVKV